MHARTRDHIIICGHEYVHGSQAMNLRIYLVLVQYKRTVKNFKEVLL